MREAFKGVDPNHRELTPQEMVREFHRTFGYSNPNTPTVGDSTLHKLRLKLILEEWGEYSIAMAQDDLIGIADALGDLLYVVYGAAVSHGIDIEPIFKEIHRSNMSKVGGHKDQDGKWIKPDTYSPANLFPILQRQLFDI